MFGSNSLESLHCLLADQIRDLHDSENRLVKSLPKIAESARCKRLRDAVLAYYEDAKDHTVRLTELAHILDFKITGKTCRATKGLLDEAEEAGLRSGDNDVVDIAILIAVRNLCRHEISAYSETLEVARQLRLMRVVQTFEDTLRDEEAAERQFARLAAAHLIVAPHIPNDDLADEAPAAA